MGRKVRMICTVGTSTLGFQEVADIIARSNLPALKNYKEEDLLRSDLTPLLDFSQALTLPPTREDHVARQEALKLLANISTMLRDELKKIVDDPNFSTNYNFPSAETQTILRWLHMANREKDPDKHIERLHVILMPSPTPNQKSMITAHAACAYLHRLETLFPDTSLICDLDKDILPVPINVDRREDFLKSVSALFKGFDDGISEKEEDEEIVICATGGYKAISGFAMLYAQINAIPCLYSFETSPQAYELMSIPLGYAYAMLDEEINTLKAIKDNINLNLDAMPRWVQDSKEMAGVLLKSYDRAKKKPYGTGEALFAILRGYGGKGPAWADYLEDLLVQKWAYLWVGDQIPETVEHSRRHSKRLMEFTANLFRIAPKKMETLGFNKEHPENLAILIAAIYLHDIGHTVLSYPILSQSLTLDVLPLGLFPSAVREVHHLLTGVLLWDDPNRYFKRSNHENGDDEKARWLGLCVSLVSAYHRSYTVLKNGKATPNGSIPIIGELLFGNNEFDKTLLPLRNRYQEMRGSCPVDPEHILNIAALLRVIDGCDVQADRVISQDYLDYRNQRSSDEALILDTQLMTLEEFLSPSGIAGLLESLRSSRDEKTVKDVCRDIYVKIFEELGRLKEQHHTWRVVQRMDMPLFMALSLANRVAFKTEQYLHFRKHQHVGFVLPVLDGNTVIVKVFPNEDLRNDPANRGILQGVCKDIDDEYLAVKDILNKEIIRRTLAFKAEIVEV